MSAAIEKAIAEPGRAVGQACSAKQDTTAIRWGRATEPPVQDVPASVPPPCVPRPRRAAGATIGRARPGASAGRGSPRATPREERSPIREPDGRFRHHSIKIACPVGRRRRGMAWVRGLGDETRRLRRGGGAGAEVPRVMEGLSGVQCWITRSCRDGKICHRSLPSKTFQGDQGDNARLPEALVPRSCNTLHSMYIHN